MGLATPHLTISSSTGHFVPFVPHCLRESWNSPRVFPISLRAANTHRPVRGVWFAWLDHIGIRYRRKRHIARIFDGGDAGSGTGISGCGGSGGISTGGMPGSGAGGRGTWSAWSASNFSKTNILCVPLTVSFEDDDEANARWPTGFREQPIEEPTTTSPAPENPPKPVNKTSSWVSQFDAD
jgi:hypothetical protein